MSESVLEVRNLNYSYPDGTPALKEINIDVSKGESVGIIGPNGAGKSTFLLHLNGILRGKGNINILDFEMEDRNLSCIRKAVGLVFQDPDDQLFMPTVFDDVAFGPINMGLSKKEVEDSVIRALKEVDMLNSIRRSAHHLSFGEKKRVAIATVLSMNPEILVLDEPSSNLDPKHRRTLINFLKSLKLTKIVATHDLDLVLEVSSRIILIDNGELIKEGKVLDILSDKNLLEAHGLEIPALLAAKAV
ncbi:MAG: ABC transporter ATP-binding protein [Candidatus Omnitrophica bacterium]|nr:ABC transporter ATP-binding protein [Candidatus Omnitrophota bacterium]